MLTIELCVLNWNFNINGFEWLLYHTVNVPYLAVILF